MCASIAAASAAIGSGCAASRSIANVPGGFAISGDPASSSGATWTYRGTLNGVTYDLSGALFKPAGPGPFPAVILSHGSGGSAGFYASLIAPTMVNWGLVCIAVNYTHSAGVPIGSPGGASDVGASQANVLRGQLTRTLLAQLGYVDTARVALHGHSMGAYVDVALAAAYPEEFRAASETGGGVRPDYIVAGPAPSPAVARQVRTPFQIHHGDADSTVPLSFALRFDSVLASAGVEHQLHVYPGESHLQVRLDPTMLARVQAWYAAHGMF